MRSSLEYGLVVLDYRDRDIASRQEEALEKRALVKGDAKSRVRTPDVRRLSCSDELKEIIYRCIGERRKRYETADELIEALRHPPATLKVGALRTLKGMHLAFTGILSRPRKDAVRAARRAGAIVHGAP